MTCNKENYTGNEPATETQLDFCFQIACELELEIPCEAISDSACSDPFEKFTTNDADNFIKEHKDAYYLSIKKVNNITYNSSNGTIPDNHYMYTK